MAFTRREIHCASASFSSGIMIKKNKIFYITMVIFAPGRIRKSI